VEYTVIIISSDNRKTVRCHAGENLQKLIKSNGFWIYTPCGGKGKCGKCRVTLAGKGSVTSCLYNVNEDITVILPDKREMSILSGQYESSIDVPLSPGDDSQLVTNPLGFAIDIGTTTVVSHLTDLTDGSVVATWSHLNPQSVHGADVISRINYCMDKPEALQEMQTLIIQSLNEVISKAALMPGIDSDRITKFSIAGNPTMLHLLAAVDPKSIALAPFKPAFTACRIIPAADLNLNCNKKANIHLLPSVSGYVGADIVAGIASVDDTELNTYLYIDIGTNGEIALVTRDKIWACATAAGPAFEGANISCGSGAFAGAISRYSRAGVGTIANQKPVSICGSGLVDIVSSMVQESVIISNGYISQPFIVSKKELNGIESDIVITQQDIREVQLAKGAIAAGISILMKKSGYSFDSIDKLFLAGGFGNYLDIDNAMRIGLLPVEMSGKVIQIGNAAGTGALLALKSQKYADNLKRIVDKTTNIELSYEEDFALEFAMNMSFNLPS